MGLRMLPGPTPWEKIRQNNKEAQGLRASLHCSPPAALPTITGRSGTHKMYTMNSLISLFILRIMGLSCALWRAGIIIPTSQMGKQKPGETGGFITGDAAGA